MLLLLFKTFQFLVPCDLLSFANVEAEMSKVGKKPTAGYKASESMWNKWRIPTCSKASLLSEAAWQHARSKVRVAPVVTVKTPPVQIPAATKLMTMTHHWIPEAGSWGTLSSCPCLHPKFLFLQRRFQHSSLPAGLRGRLSFACSEQGQPCPAGPAGSSPAAAGAEQPLLAGTPWG